MRNITPPIRQIDYGSVYEPNEDERNRVRRMAAMGTPEHIIAATAFSAPVTIRTLYAVCYQEMMHGQYKSHLAVADALFKQAVSGNVRACELWLKTQSGWVSEKKITHHLTIDEEEFIDMSRISESALKEIIAAHEKQVSDAQEG